MPLSRKFAKVVPDFGPRQPNYHQGWPTARERLGVFGVFLYAFAMSAYPPAMEIALLFMLVSLPIACFKRESLADPLFIASCFLVLFLSLSIYAGSKTTPHLISEHFSQAAYVLLIPILSALVAIHIKGNPNLIKITLLVALLGVITGIIYPIVSGEIEFSTLFGGARHEFGFQNPIRLGLFSSAALLGLVLWMPLDMSHKKGQWIIAILFLLGIVITAYALLLSQTRASWLGALLTIPIALFVRLFLLEKKFGRVALWSVFVATAIAIVFVANSELVESRWQQSQPSLSALIGQEELPYDSIGIRLHSWKFGLEHIVERPFFGHGPASVRHYLENSGNRHLRRFGQFHSTPIDLMFRFGLVNTFLVALIFSLFFYSCMSAWRTRRVDPIIPLFLAGALVIFLIDSLTVYGIRTYQVRYYIGMIGGLAYSFHLYCHIAPGQKRYAH